MQEFLKVIKDIVNEGISNNQEQYENFCKDNPGYVMHNSPIRVMAYEQILRECLTLEELKQKKERHLRDYCKAKGPNGHWIIAGVCQRVIDKIENG